MSVYPEYYIEAKFDGITWEVINRDIVQDITGEYGIFGNSPIDRMAGPGDLKLVFNNTITNSAHLVGYYTPGHFNCRPGFDVGLEIRLRFVIEDIDIIKWSGSIPADGIDLDTGRYAATFTRVTVRDWLEQAANYELQTPQFATNKTIMDGVASILAEMGPQPSTVTYKTAESVFATIFSTISSTTRALTELAAMALSELSYIYLTRVGLIVEGRYTRTIEKKTIARLPMDEADCGALLNDSGGYILNSSGGKIHLHQMEDAIFDNSQKDSVTKFGRTLANRIKLMAYPRKIDTAATTVLYSLNAPIYLASGETVVVSGSYSDPTGVYKNVSATDLVTPIATTHYLMNSLQNGSGTNLTAYLNVMFSSGSGKPIFTLTNTGAAGGWITKLQAVGIGIYTPDPTTLIVKDDDSIAKYTLKDLTLDMKYQDDPNLLAPIGSFLLAQLKDPRREIENVNFEANRNKKILKAFIELEPGDRIRYIEDISGTDGEFFIQGVKFVIKPKGKIDFTWYLKDAGLDSYDFAVWDIDAWDDGSTWGF